MTKMTALFAELATLDKQMAEENADMSIRQLTNLDDRHTQVWGEIIAYKPANKEIAELMVLMLLDRMQAMAARGENCMLIREKLLELFSESFAEPKHYMRMVEADSTGAALA